MNHYKVTFSNNRIVLVQGRDYEEAQENAIDYLYNFTDEMVHSVVKIERAV